MKQWKIVFSTAEVTWILVDPKSLTCTWTGAENELFMSIYAERVGKRTIYTN